MVLRDTTYKYHRKWLGHRKSQPDVSPDMNHCPFPGLRLEDPLLRPGLAPDGPGRALRRRWISGAKRWVEGTIYTLEVQLDYILTV